MRPRRWALCSLAVLGCSGVVEGPLVPPAVTPETTPEASWRLPAKDYLDATVRSADAAYSQDPWDEVMQGVSGAPLNPFFDAAGFNCVREDQGEGALLRCPARRSEPRVAPVRRLVLHNTLESLPDTVAIFSRNTPFFRSDRNYPVSIHYVVGRDGTVVGMVPEDRVAYHAGGAEKNGNSIGIEVVANVSDDPNRGHPAARRWSLENRSAELFHTEGMTLPQYQSLLRLMSNVVRDHDLNLDQVVSHQDVTPATTCPSSIWKTAAGFSEWKRTDLQAHMGCAASEPSLDGFAACLE